MSSTGRVRTADGQENADHWDGRMAARSCGSVARQFKISVMFSSAADIGDKVVPQPALCGSNHLESERISPNTRQIKANSALF